MGTLRLTADSSQLVSEVKKAKEALKSAKSEYKAASAEAELYGTKEGQLVNKIKAANQMQATRTAALQTYERAITQLKSEIDKWEKEEQELILKLKEAQKANDTAKVNEYTAAIEKLRKQIKDNTTEINTTNKAYYDLRAEMAQTEKQTRDLTEELDDLSNVVEEVETATDESDDSMEDFGDGAEGAGTAVFSLQSALSTASGMLRDFGDLLDGITNKFEALIDDGIKATADALVSLGKYSLTTGAGFETAMSELMATMGLDKTAAAYEPLKETAEYYGRTTKYTATEAAQALNILAQSGLTAEEQMEALPTVLNLASAGAMDLKTAATYATASVKGFGDEMANASMYADLIAKGASLANTDANMLGAALSGAAANAKAYSQDADSLTVSLLRLAEQNVKGTDAATALNRIMMDLYTPTSAAAEALDKLGVSAYDDFNRARDLNDVINDLNIALQGYDEESQNIIKNSIFSTYGLNAFNKMVVTSTDKVDEWTDVLANANGAAANMAETMIDNLQGDMAALQSASEGIGLKIYEGIAPGLRQAIQAVTSFLTDLTDNFNKNGLGDAIGKISTAFQNFATKIPKLLETHSPTIIKIFNSIVDILVIMIDYLPVLIDTALPQFLEIVESIAGKLPGFLDKIMPVLIDGIGWLISNFPILIAGLYGLQGAAGAGAGLLDIGGIVAGIAVAAKAAGTSLGAIASAAAPVLGVIAAVAAAIAAVVAIIGTAWATSESFRNYCTDVFSGLKQQFGDMVKTISDSVIRIMQLMGLEVESGTDALNVVLTAVKTVATVIVFVLSQLISMSMTYVELVVGSFTSTYETLVHLVEAIMYLLDGNFAAAKTSLGNMMSSVGTGFSNMWNTVRDSCSGFADDFGDFLIELQNVTANNPLKVKIESDLDKASFEQDIRMIASWGLPGFNANQYLDKINNSALSPIMTNNNGKGWKTSITNSIDVAKATVTNSSSNNVNYNNTTVNNNNNYTWNTDTEGDENAWVKMQRETEVRTKYTSA